MKHMISFNRNPRKWIQAEVARDAVPSVAIQNMLDRLCCEIFDRSTLVCFPRRALLPWPCCTPGENLDALPEDPKDMIMDCIAATGLAEYERKRLQKELKERGILSLEKYPVHPEHFAFQFAGGQHPAGWTFHHLYDGVFPFGRRKKTLDARKHGKHFTQAAGMVTVHPIVQELYDCYSCIRHTLRARSFAKFGYDPDSFFTKDEHDQFGFVVRNSLDESDDGPELPPAPVRPTFSNNIRERLAARRGAENVDLNQNV